jgi:hypothetical protein
LFSRAIAQSGCALNPWAFNTRSEARRKAFRFGEALGCKTNDSKELAEFLNTVPAQQLVEGVSKAMTELVRRRSKTLTKVGVINILCSYTHFNVVIWRPLSLLFPLQQKLEHFEHTESNLATYGYVLQSFLEINQDHLLSGFSDIPYVHVK